jgi:nucleotide-binding universal stress UspA family protein
MKTIRRILVPTDFSACADEAARTALEFAERFGATLTLFHAHMPPVAAIADGGAFVPGPHTLSQLTEEAKAALERLKGELDRGTVKIDVQSIYGPSSDAIVRFAREGGYDMIVLGTHGHTGLKHLLLGSVAERVVRTASCPVMTVRHTDESIPTMVESPPVL